MPSTVTKMNVAFLDTDDEDIYSNGWSPRIRKMEGEDDFELDYKKRYPITNNDINAALTQANNDGFDSGDEDYDAQVEWGYQNSRRSASPARRAAARKATAAWISLRSATPAA